MYLTLHNQDYYIENSIVNCYYYTEQLFLKTKQKVNKDTVSLDYYKHVVRKYLS